MRRLTIAAGLAVLCLLGGCATNTPMCRYWSDAVIGKGLDPSQVPMLPANPYWTEKGTAAAPGDPCYGEPPPEAVHG